MIPVGYVMFLRTSVFISQSLDKLNNIFKGVLDGKKVSVNDEEFLDNPKEIKETFSCFQTIKSTFDQAVQAFDTGNNTDALIKYSVGLRFYERVNNYAFAGIICNNIANIYL